MQQDSVRSAPTARLADLTELVRVELAELNRELLEELRPDQQDLQPLIERALGYRGKQMRPALVFLSARAVGSHHGEALDRIRRDVSPADLHGQVGLNGRHGSSLGSNGHASGQKNGHANGHLNGHAQPTPESRLHALLTVAKTVELIHTASLVHDDVLDDASIRRKLATINAMHGNEIPVLLGDYVYARAFSLSVSLDDPTCGRVLGEVVRRMCQGEITQIFHRFDFEWDEERYIQVIHDKTATLYAASSRLGAHYGGGTPEQVEALDTYGREFGIAFQIIDDCLDLVGDEAVVGKSLGTDLTRGKLTLPLLDLMREPEQGARLRALMSEGDPTDEASNTGKLERLRAEFPLREAIDRSVAAAHGRIRIALEALDVLDESPAKAQLREIAEYVLTRKL